MATDGKKLNQLPELTTLTDSTMFYAVDGGEDYHVDFETIKDETVPEVFTPTTNGLVPHPNSGNGGKVLRGDGTWQGTFDSSNDGLVPKLGTNDKDNVLRGDGAWVVNDKLIGTGSGSLVTFDAIEAPMPSLKVSVEAKQDLHGYDKPWVGGAGKNKLQNTGTTATVNGVTFTVNDDGSVLVNGTATNVAYFDINTFNSLSQSYIVNGCPVGGAYNTSYSIWAVSENPYNEAVDSGSGVTIDSNFIRKIRIRIANGYTANNLVFKPMVRLATETDATFEPYSNICPIIGWDAANVSDVGKNLFDKTSQGITVGYALNPANGSTYASSSGNWDVTGFIEIEGGSDYTLSGSNGDIVFFDENKTYIVGWSSFGTRTAPQNAKYIKFDFLHTNVDSVQLELGSTATDYVSYVEPNLYTISLGQTVYGGEVDVVNGTSGNKKKYHEVKFEDLIWTNAPTGTANVYRKRAELPISGKPVNNNQTFNAICSSYDAESANDTYSCLEGVSGDPTGNYIYVYDSEYPNQSDLTDFANARKATQLVYELATPTTFETQPTPIKSLNGQNNLSVDCGEILEVEYQRSITEAINALEAGGGYSETSLWSNSSGVYTGDLALSDSIENYNALMFKVSNAQGWANFAFIPTSALASNNAKAGIGGGMQSAVWWFQFTRTDATHITINNNSSTGDKLYQIVGVKY